MKMTVKGMLYILITAFLFSTMEIAGKLLSNELTAFQVTLVRYFIGLIFMFPLAWKEMKTKKIQLSYSDFKIFLLAGIICIPISMTLLQLAVEYTKASTAAIVFSTNSVFTIPFAYIILKEKISRPMIISMLVSAIGLLCILNPFKIVLADSKGIGIALLAAFSFSLYSVLTKKYVHRYGGFVYNFFTFFAGTTVLLLLTMLMGMPVTANIDSSNLLVLAYIGVAVTGLGYICYLKAIEEVSVVKASLAFFIKPALAPVLALILIGENVTLNTLLGILLVILGSGLSFSLQREKAKSI